MDFELHDLDGNPIESSTTPTTVSVIGDVVRTRKQRSDKGVKRGPYGPRKPKTEIPVEATGE